MKKPSILVVNEHSDINPRAKSLFYDTMIEAGIQPKKFKWLDVLTTPPAEGKNVTKTMIKNARDRVQAKITKRDPKYMILLGNTPLQAVLDQTGIRKMRGKPVEWQKRIVMPVNHPNMAFHDDKYETTLLSDLARLKECMQFGGIPEEKSLDFVIVDNHSKVKAMLRDLRGTVAVDLETSRLYPFTTQQDELVESGRASETLLRDHRATHGSNNLPRVVAMQFGTRTKQWVVPMETAGIWNEEELKVIVEDVTHALNERCLTVFHNGKFDCLWMLVRFGVKWKVDFDTLLAHYLLDENDLHGLKYLAQKFLGVPDWDIGNKEGAKTTWSLKNAKYAAHDVFYTRKLKFIFSKMFKEDEDIKRVFDLIMMPCVEMFIEAEFEGVYINEDQFGEAEVFLREELRKSGEALDKWAKKAELVDVKGPNKGKINWGSPKQLADLLFRVLKIPARSEWKTKTGYSTAETVLNQIDHPMVGDLIKFRGHKQQLSFFIEGWKPYLDLNGKLHPSFKLHGTVTGRLSCENPNLQQVPRDPRIRTLITAIPGWTLMEADLSQIELRLAADAADESDLLAVFHSGGDPHWQTAIREIERGAGYRKEMIKTAKLHSGKKMKYSEAVEYVLSIGGDAAAETVASWAETKALEPFMNWKETRKKAKAINFGYLYGMWWKKFKIYARDNYGVDVTDDEAMMSREAFFELYPKFNKWHTKQKRFAQVNGYVRSLSGRKRRLPAAMGGRDSPQRREAQRQAINSPIQSFANELNLMAALQMREEFSPKWFRLVGTVHDAVLVIVRNDKVAEVYKRVLEIMSRPRLLTDFEIDLNVPIEAEAKCGPWAAGVSIDKWLKANPKVSKRSAKKESEAHEKKMRRLRRPHRVTTTQSSSPKMAKSTSANRR